MENWKLSLQNEFPEYYLTDVNKDLKDKDIDVYFNYEQMPIAGYNYRGRVLLGSFHTPENFIKGSKRKYRPSNKQPNY